MTTRRTATAAITAVTSVAALAAAMPAHAVNSHHHQPPGVYVAKQGLASRGTEPASFVSDRNGKAHLVTVQPTSGGNGKIVYRTKKASAPKWTSHAVPGARPLRHLHIEAHLSANGSRVFVVFYQCNGVYVVDASLAGSRLPEPVLVKTESNCAAGAVDPYVTPTGVPEQRAAAIYANSGARNDHIAIMLYDSALRTDSTAEIGWRIYYGTPTAGSNGEGLFDPGDPILAADSTLTPRQLVIDPETFRATAIATGTQHAKAAVFALRSIRFKPWTVVDIATLGEATANYTIQSSIAYRRWVYVGLQRPARFARKAALYLVKLSAGGTSSGAIPLAHSGPTDTGLLIAKNTSTNHLHAVFTRRSGHHVGLMAEMQPNGGGWTKPASFSTSRTDRAIALYVTPHGRNVIAYRHG